MLGAVLAMEGAVISRSRAGLRGSIRKLLKPLQQPIPADSCCKRGCDLGMYADARFSLLSPGGKDGLGCLCRHRFRFVSAALAAYKKLPASNTSSLPTAVLLPCTHVISGLAAGEVTDHDLRVSLLGSTDADGYALVHFASCTLQRSSQSTLDPMQGGPSTSG